MNKTLRKILLVLNVILVIVTFGSYLAPHIKPEISFLFPILGLGFPALLLANVIAVSVWLMTSPRLAMLSLITMLLGVGSCSRILNISIADSPVDGSIKVATYNANFSKPIQFATESKKAEVEQNFISYLKKNDDIDILCVQENGQISKSYLASAMNFSHRHSIEEMTVSIYSKHPFKATGFVDFNSNIANTCIWADIEIGENLVRVYSTHLESNRQDGKVPDVIVENAPEEMNNSALLGIVKHYQKFSIDRARQAQLIKAHAEKISHPVIICGDLNDTPQSHVYKIAKGDLQDSFVEEGLGIGSTFGERIPALRIDYIFVDKSIEVLDHDISRSDFSDHYLISTELAF